MPPFMFYQLPIVTLKTPLYKFSFILNNTHVLKPVTDQKIFMMSGKVETFSKQNGKCKKVLIYYVDFVYPASEL